MVFIYSRIYVISMQDLYRMVINMDSPLKSLCDSDKGQEYIDNKGRKRK
jgi:hypothetical protein